MGQETINLIQDIVESYGYHDPKEGPLNLCIRYIDKTYAMNKELVTLAFKASASNEIDIELKTVFSVKEIMRVMNAYSSSRQPSSKKKKKGKPPTPTDLDLIEEEFKKSLIREFNKLKEGKPYCLSPGFCYHWLEQKGLIEMGYDKSDWIVERAKQSSKAKIKSQLGHFNSKNLLADFEKGTLKGDNMAIFQTKCQAIALDQFFKGMIEKNIDFEANLNQLI